MATEQRIQDIKKIIRCLLISCPKEMTVGKLRHDFIGEAGHDIPFHDLGHHSVTEFLRSIPDVCTIDLGFDDRCIVRPVATQKTAHVDSLVSRQRVTAGRGRRRPRSNQTPRPHYQRQTAPQYRPITKHPSSYYSSGTAYLPKQIPSLLDIPVKPPPSINHNSFTEPVTHTSNHSLSMRHSSCPSAQHSEFEPSASQHDTTKTSSPVQDTRYNGNLELDEDFDQFYDEFEDEYGIEEEFENEPLAIRCTSAIPNSVQLFIYKILAEHPKGISLTVLREMVENYSFRNNISYTLPRNMEEIISTLSNCKVVGNHIFPHNNECETQSEAVNNLTTESDHSEDSDGEDFATEGVEFDCEMSNLSPVLKNIVTLLREHRIGVPLSEFYTRYKNRFGVPLKLTRSFGVESVEELVINMPHLFECAHDGIGQPCIFLVTRDATEKSQKLDCTRPHLPGIVKKGITLLLEAYPNGLKSEQFISAYKDMLSEDIELDEMGFKNLESFLKFLHEQGLIVLRQRSDEVLLFLATSSGLCIDEPRSALEEERAQAELKKLFPPDVVGPDFEISQVEFPEEVEKQQFFELQVGEVINPHKFYILFGAYTLKLNHTMNEMQNFYCKEATDYKMPPRAIRIGQVCVAMEYDEYTRGQIVKLLNDLSVEVFFFDYGTFRNKQKKDIFFLHKEFSALPSQAVNATLLNVAPIGSDWPRDASDCFLKFIRCKRLFGLACGFNQQERVLYLRDMCDTTGENDQFLSDFMVKEGHAVKPNFEIETLAETEKCSVSQTDEDTTPARASSPQSAQNSSAFPVPFSDEKEGNNKISLDSSCGMQGVPLCLQRKDFPLVMSSSQTERCNASSSSSSPKCSIVPSPPLEMANKAHFSDVTCSSEVSSHDPALLKDVTWKQVRSLSSLNMSNIDVDKIVEFKPSNLKMICDRASNDEAFSQLPNDEAQHARRLRPLPPPNLVERNNSNSVNHFQQSLPSIHPVRGNNAVYVSPPVSNQMYVKQGFQNVAYPLLAPAVPSPPVDLFGLICYEQWRHQALMNSFPPMMQQFPMNYPQHFYPPIRSAPPGFTTPGFHPPGFYPSGPPPGMGNFSSSVVLEPLSPRSHSPQPTVSSITTTTISSRSSSSSAEPGESGLRSPNASPGPGTQSPAAPASAHGSAPVNSPFRPNTLSEPCRNASLLTVTTDVQNYSLNKIQKDTMGKTNTPLKSCDVMSNNNIQSSAIKKNENGALGQVHFEQVPQPMEPEPLSELPEQGDANINTYSHPIIVHHESKSQEGAGNDSESFPMMQRETKSVVESSDAENDKMLAHLNSENTSPSIEIVPKDASCHIIDDTSRSLVANTSLISRNPVSAPSELSDVKNYASNKSLEGVADDFKCIMEQKIKDTKDSIEVDQGAKNHGSSIDEHETLKEEDIVKSDEFVDCEKEVGEYKIQVKSEHYTENDEAEHSTGNGDPAKVTEPDMEERSDRVTGTVLKHTSGFNILLQAYGDVSSDDLSEEEEMTRDHALPTENKESTRIGSSVPQEAGISDASKSTENSETITDTKNAVEESCVVTVEQKPEHSRAGSIVKETLKEGELQSEAKIDGLKDKVHGSESTILTLARNELSVLLRENRKENACRVQNDRSTNSPSKDLTIAVENNENILVKGLDIASNDVVLNYQKCNMAASIPVKQCEEPSSKQFEGVMYFGDTFDSGQSYSCDVGKSSEEVGKASLETEKIAGKKSDLIDDEGENKREETLRVEKFPDWKDTSVKVCDWDTGSGNNALGMATGESGRGPVEHTLADMKRNDVTHKEFVSDSERKSQNVEKSLGYGCEVKSSYGGSGPSRCTFQNEGGDNLHNNTGSTPRREDRPGRGDGDKKHENWSDRSYGREGEASSSKLAPGVPPALRHKESSDAQKHDPPTKRPTRPLYDVTKHVVATRARRTKPGHLRPESRFDRELSVHKISLANKPIHLINFDGRVYLSTNEVVRQFTHFTGIHVVVKILDSRNAEVPFLELNRDLRPDVFEYLDSTDIWSMNGGAKGEMLHMLPLKSLPFLFQMLNVKLSIEDAIKEISIKLGEEKNSFI